MLNSTYTDGSVSVYIFQQPVWHTANDCNTSFGVLSFDFGRCKAQKIEFIRHIDISPLLVSKFTKLHIASQGSTENFIRKPVKYTKLEGQTAHCVTATCLRCMNAHMIDVHLQKECI